MCKFVVIIWQDLSAWLSVKLHHDFNLKNLHKLFGFGNCNGVFQFANGLFLYARVLNYQANILNQDPKWHSIVVCYIQLSNLNV